MGGISKVRGNRKASLAPYFQNLYHDKILGLRDVVWEKALPQRFHLNFNLIQRKRIPVLEKFAFLYEWFGNMGTQRIALGGRFGFLIGTSQALSFLVILWRCKPMNMESILDRDKSTVFTIL